MNDYSFIIDMMNSEGAIMRKRDENKRNAILDGCVRAVNRVGFAGATMAMIAREAALSAGTIYLYFDNRREMVNQAYLKVKLALSLRLLGDEEFKFRDYPGRTEEVEAKLRRIIRESIAVFMENRDDLLFIEQFANSPLIKGVNRLEAHGYFKPVQNLLEMGMEAGIVVKAPPFLLMEFVSAPIIQLVKKHHLGELELVGETLQWVEDLAWNSISTGVHGIEGNGIAEGHAENLAVKNLRREGSKK
ncbi:MAG: hypothetical protein CVV64_17305 [Candidatus Wallbacteria bacterium HGW-Wallbacteria-1]|jgi:AcrR family transcriptional regulator|uniref:HTH tetR-type domain-containing protein n=1 Tax=Candidatus Wallbacteria bacterium HGW-Wallbacteria-1 TaxID=2013854 RepID=A0A2N1PK82_9BACT|nr:MAG: hypothetical protein CVV64_17305 [Candidatus Wallbacteria bacterium HGW-Wallbacteria-1]